MNKTKTAMITVCGRPNVGKSSLTNALVGEKIAIVSNKPQTTRNRIYGVVNRGDTQYVLLDTPGFHKARNRLGDYMVKVTRESIADVDAVLLLVEPVAHVGIPEAELIEKIKASHLPAILCINKIDTVEKKDDLLAVIAAYSEAYAFDAIIPISARTHEGLDDLMNELGKYASEGPQLFPDGMTTDQPDRQVVGEIVREKLLRNLDKEIPHGTAVEITRFIERDDEVIESPRPSTAKRRATRVSSSAKTARCSRRSRPRPAATSSASWAQRSTSRLGSRSRKTGATI